MSEGSEGFNKFLRILIIDDEEQMCESLKALLEKEGFSVDYSTNARDAFVLLNERSYNLLICDIRMPEMGGLTLLSKIGTKIPVIMITAHASIETARTAFKLGASDYLAKPFKFDELLVVVKQFIARKPLENPDSDSAAIFMRSKNPEHRRLMDLAEKFSAADLPILITGESGTGKEVVADYLYSLNLHSIKRSAYVKINCAAIPNELLEGELFGYEKGSFTGAVTSRKGKVEEADGGILFLDEIGEMPLLLQAKILRFVQDFQVCHIGSNKPVTIRTRIIAASNQDLDSLVDQGRFRLDLYHRLKGGHLKLLPLRERREDILDLADFFLERYCRKYQKRIESIDDGVKKIFLSYDWPGNTRELKYCIERSVVVCDEPFLSEKFLPDNIGVFAGKPPADGFRPMPEGNQSLDAGPAGNGGLATFSASIQNYRNDYMRKLIIAALVKTNGNKLEAAKLLNVSRQTLYNRIKELDIQSDYR